MSKAKTHRDYINTGERRAMVLKLRKAGATYAEIANSVQKAANEGKLSPLPAGWNPLYAYKDVMREMEKRRLDMDEDVVTVRLIELERLDDMQKGLWPMVVSKRPDLQAIDRMLKIMDRRSKYLGLDAPTKVDGLLRSVNLGDLTDSQIDRLAEGEDLLSVLANPNTTSSQGGA